MGGAGALSVAVALTVSACSLVGDVPQPDLPEVREDVGPRRRTQTRGQALADDNARAAAQGNPQSSERGEAFGRLSARIARARPGLFAGAVNGQPPTLYIKGGADAFVRGVVSKAPFAIEVVEGMPFSRRELEQRSRRLADALGELGYRSYTVSFDETRGQSEATVTRQPSLPSTVRELRAALAPELVGNLQLDLIDHPAGVDY